MTIDRETRESLIRVMDRYLNDDISAFELDEVLLDLRDKSTDETVHAAIDILYDFYDDCDDHNVVMNRAGWDYWQRLRLVLSSDATLKTETKRIWSLTQFLAAVAFGWFAWLATKMGFGEQLLIVAIPFGLVSIFISFWRRRLTAARVEFDPFLSPFTSVWQLWDIRRAAPHFHKRRYRKELASRRINRLVGEFGMNLQMYISWTLFGPAVLIFQAFPISIRVRQVVS